MNRLVVLLLLSTFIFPAAVTAEGEYWEYTFKPGDSIWKIAKKYTTTVNNWAELRKLNEIHQGPDRRIPPGTRIIIPVAMLKLRPVPAKVIAVSGEVYVERKEGGTDKVAVGTELHSGDKVSTDDYQNLRMQFADESELQVLPNSEVILDKLSHHKDSGMADTRMRLNAGSVNTWVEKQNSDSRYEIKTPAAITAVRGTAFRLTADGDKVSRTEVTEGIVGVTAGKSEKGVNDGYGIVAEKDKALAEPVKLLPAPALKIIISEDESEYSASWLPLVGAKSYHYRIANDSDFNYIVTDKFTHSNTISLDSLPTGTYYLSVRGVDKFLLEGVDAVANVEKKPIPEHDEWYWKIIMSVGLLVLFL